MRKTRKAFASLFATTLLAAGLAPGLEGLFAVSDDIDVQAQGTHHRGQNLLVRRIVLGRQNAQGAVFGVFRPSES